MSLEASPLRQLGKYEILEKIAEGGMGAVYKGRHSASGEIVAIKVIPPETARNPLLLKRFEQEFRVASLINHPNVVRAVDYCGSGPTPFLVMEFVDGESIGQRIQREGAIPEEEAIRLMGQVCEGLRRAHKQGLVHRDVKPDNIMLTQNAHTAKLTDLGLVKDLEGEMNLTRTGRGLGTPHFMAPEQFRNAKGADERCDIYSLGATLYMMLTGEIPFDKTSPLDCWLKKTKNDFPKPIELRPEISPRTNWAVCRAMSADPTARPASCREFMEDLIGADWRSQQHSNDQSLGGASNPSITPAPLVVGGQDLWYLVYRDKSNQPRTVKGSTESVRKNVQSGALGDTAEILVSRTKIGQFVSLRNVPEFRDLVMGAAETLNNALAEPTPTQLITTHFNPPKTDQSARKAKPAADSPQGDAAVRYTVGARPKGERGGKPEQRQPVIPGLNIKPLDQRSSQQRKAELPANKFDPMPWILISLAIICLGMGIFLVAR